VLSPEATAAFAAAAVAVVKAEGKLSKEGCVVKSDFLKAKEKLAGDAKKRSIGQFFSAETLSDKEKEDRHAAGLKKLEEHEEKKRKETVKQSLLAASFQWVWPIPKTASMGAGAPRLQDRYNDSVRDFIIAGVQDATLSADEKNLVWPADRTKPRAPPKEPPAGYYRKGVTIDEVIDEVDSRKRKAAATLENATADAAAGSKKQKPAGKTKSRNFQPTQQKLFYDLARSPWGKQMSQNGQVAMVKEMLPNIFTESFSARTVHRWNSQKGLDKFTAPEWEKYIEAGRVGKSTAELQDLQATSDPYNFEDYRHILPVHVLYSCRAMAKSLEASGIPADSRVLMPAFRGVVEGMGFGHLLAPEDTKGRGDADEDQTAYHCVEKDSDGEVVSRRLILNQRWTNWFCRRANLTVRAATAGKEKEPSEEELHDTKELYNLRYVWLVKKFNIKVDFTCNLDGTAFSLGCRRVVLVISSVSLIITMCNGDNFRGAHA
jgi:hypothetical protein